METTTKYKSKYFTQKDECSFETLENKEHLTEIESYFKNTRFFVEANSNETHELWYRDHYQRKEFIRVMKNKFNINDQDVLDEMADELNYFDNDWEQLRGVGITIGIVKNGEFYDGISKEDHEIKDLPIHVSFMFNIINGVVVCFYNPTSLLVHHEIVEDFIQHNWPLRYDNGHRRAMTDAMNFHSNRMKRDEFNEYRNKIKR